MIDSETPIFWPPDVKGQLIRKDPDAGEDWRQEENGVTEDEMVRWHHRLTVHKFVQTLGGSGGQRSLAWAHIELIWLNDSTTKTTVQEASLRSGYLNWDLNDEKEAAIFRSKTIPPKRVNEWTTDSKDVSNYFFHVQAWHISAWHKHSQWGGRVVLYKFRKGGNWQA